MDLNNPKVSIILPVYNAGEYLRAAIKSILTQSFTDFEFIIINDCSPDDPEPIVRSFTDPRIKFVINKLNLGLAETLNVGLELAKAPIIARMDQDDISRPRRLEKQYKYLEKHRDIYLVGGGYAPFNEKGTRVELIHPGPSVELAFKYIENNYLCHPAVMFRKSVLAKVGNYPNTMPEDYDFFSKIVRRFPCYNLQEILIDYREHATNLSKVKADTIQASVKRISKENYVHFNGSLADYETMISYIATRKYNRKNLFPVLFRSHRILWSITGTYYPFPKSLFQLNKYYFKLVLLPLFRQLFNHFKQRIV